MGLWNYVVIAHKPGAVTHSRVGRFTGPEDLNLITASYTRIQIHLHTPEGFQLMSDVPTYGRITNLEIFRVLGETKDLLYIAIEIVEFRAYKICVLRSIWDLSDNGECIDCIPVIWPIDCIDPDVIKFVDGQLKEPFYFWLETVKVRDFKFLYGCSHPTIALLCQDSVHEDIGIHLRSVVFPINREEHFKKEEIRHLNVEIDADALITVLPPLCGVLIIGPTTVEYYNKVASKEISSKCHHCLLYGDMTVYGSNYFRYLLGSPKHLHQLLDPLQSSKGPSVEDIHCFFNFGSIVDFCMLDLEKNGQSLVASIKLEGIKGMWSLRSSTDDRYDTFCVVSFVNTMSIFAMNQENEFMETEIEGFCSDVRTKFCHGAVYNQLLQVTSNSVRLVNSNSRQLLCDWSPPECSINVATANATQVLLATSNRYLFYLEIGDQKLIETKNALFDYDISCLDINPIGDNPKNKYCVLILSLPELNVITKEHLGGGIVPRSVLLCSFEEISYLLCGLGDGQLLKFVLNTASNNELVDTKKMSLGTQQVTLWTFSSKNATHVFAASDRPTVIYSSNKTFLVIAAEGKLTISTIGDIGFIFQRIPLDVLALHICHQEQTQTFAIIQDSNIISLLDATTFEFISTYSLNEGERGNSILSCSFSDDRNVYYYCVGTARCRGELSYRFLHHARLLIWILVFSAEDRKLKLIAEKITEGPVISLHAFNGKLLAAISTKIQLYKWFHDLHIESAHDVPDLVTCVQTRGDFIIVAQKGIRMSLLYNHESGAFEEQARHNNSNSLLAPHEFLDDDIYLGADWLFNLFTVRNIEGTEEVIGQYHLGESVSRFEHGSLVMRLQDTDVGQIPTVIFAKTCGGIGVIASLPQEQYVLLEKLQLSMNKVIKGVGGSTREEWRSIIQRKDGGSLSIIEDTTMVSSIFKL
ncbi:hypothetical protein ACJIZ3_014265 [Penstemon smallii]|uniref:DNA damage-binding protein 1 n=1 Tax=Penstemon smallii TaxID=265156 RepID=A0ABD3RJ20_9LAMI